MITHAGRSEELINCENRYPCTVCKRMSWPRLQGYSPSQWVLATQPRIPESLMIDDEDEDHVLH